MFNWFKKKKKKETLKMHKGVLDALNKDNDPIMNHINKLSSEVMSDIDLDLPPDQLQAELKRRYEQRMLKDDFIDELVKSAEKSSRKKK